MADHTINIINKDVPTKHGRPYTESPKAVDKVLTQSTKVLEKTVSKSFGDFGKTLEKIMKESTKHTQSSDKVKIEDLNLLKDVLKTLPKDLSQAVMSAIRSAQSGDELSKAINDSIDKMSSSIVESLSKVAKKGGIEIDHDKLQQKVSSVVSEAIPHKSLVQLSNNLSDSIDKINKFYQASAHTITTAKHTVEGGDTAGMVVGAVDTAKSIKASVAAFQEMKSSIAEVKKDLQNLGSDFYEETKKINQSFSELKSQGKKRFISASEHMKDDPKLLVKEVYGSVKNIASTIDKTSGTNLSKSFDFIDKKVEDVNELVRGVEDFHNTLRTLSKEGKISSESVNELLDGVTEITQKLQEIPSGIDMPKINGKPIEAMQEVVDTLQKTIGSLKVIVDDTELKDLVDKNRTVKIEADIEDVKYKLKEVEAQKIKANITVDAKEFTERIHQLASRKDNKYRVNVELDKHQAFRSMHNITSSYKIEKLRSEVLRPDSKIKFTGKDYTSKDAEQMASQHEANIKNLQSSLMKLQGDIVEKLQKGFNESSSQWAVYGAKKDEPHKAFKLSKNEREWSAGLVNVGALKHKTKKYDASPEDLVDIYKKEKRDEYIDSFKGNTEKMAEAVAGWVKTASFGDIKDVGDPIVRKKLTDIQSRFKDEHVVSPEMVKHIGGSFGQDIKSIFEKTVAEKKAVDNMYNEKLVRKLTLPAVKYSEKESPTFQTLHGSHRAVPRYAEFKTGFEKIYENLEELGRLDRDKEFHKDIRKLPLRPVGAETQEAEDLAKKMFVNLTSGYKDSKTKFGELESFKDYYKTTAESKGLGDYFRKQSNELMMSVLGEGFGSPLKPDQIIPVDQKQIEASVSKFIDNMKGAGVSALDVMKSLDEIKVENVYDYMGRVLSAGSNKSPLATLSREPHYDRAIREYEEAVREIEGTLPILEVGKPRRGYHQENVVNLRTRTSRAYSKSAIEERMPPDEQKRFIKDLNLRFREIFDDIEATGGKYPGGIRTITPLNIPESSVSNVEELREGSGGGNKHQSRLYSTGLTFYSEDLPSMAPFEQFQQVGRNISNVTQALVEFDKGAEYPKLRSIKEQALKQSGRYEKGYGFNVVAELRNTASTFEDQIVIGGRLAEELTSTVKTLIAPAPGGRFGGGINDMIRGTSVTKIEEGEITERANREIMKVLGIPKKYETRAHKALIEAVETTQAVTRGQEVSVQKAKIVEEFINQFGRKFTTRYGSKGVGITPTPSEEHFQENIMGALAPFINKGIKTKIDLDPESTRLGAVVRPKTMGTLASDLFNSLGVDGGLNEDLVRSGNKFMIDLFHRVGDDALVVPEEAKKAQELFQNFSDIWKSTFGEDITPDIEGIKKLQKTYQDKLGKDLFEITPIDVRISSYGAAKRGLQPEFLETIMSNVAGTGKGGFTTMQKLAQPVYEELLGKEPGKPGALSEYSKALGYTGVGKSAKEIEKDLIALFDAKGDESKILLAKKAAALEAASNFYSEVIDEFGNQRKSLVGEKFLQIIEEPTSTPGWSEGQVESGVKGAKLNIPAFSAYATVFGEDSAMMRELKESTTLDNRKHWEYLKSIQAISNKDSDVYRNLTKGLNRKSISDFDPFYESTGMYGSKVIVDPATGTAVQNPRSFTDTILDVEKHPEPFLLQLPTGLRGPENKPVMEDFYVPGALARGTFEDPLLPGERGLEEISRRLAHVSNMGVELNKLMTDPKSFGDDYFAKRVTKTVGSWVKEANTKDVPLERLKEIHGRLAKGLTDRPVDTNLIPNAGGKSEYQYIKDFSAKQLGSGKKEEDAYKTIINTMSDLIIGKQKIENERQRNAYTGVKRSLNEGYTHKLADQLGIVQEDIDKKTESLTKAKVDYYDSLARTATGKTGSVNEVFFTRKIPAILGKAVVAVTDKTSDIKSFHDKIVDIEERYGQYNIDAVNNLGEFALASADVFKKHSDIIRKHRGAGIPVLQEDELGIPETLAEKIPIKFKRARYSGGELNVAKEETEGTLLDLLKESRKFKTLSKSLPDNKEHVSEQIENYISNELVPYIESIRYPFTGTSSLAPYKARLLEGNKYGGLEKNSLIVPGVPDGAEEISKLVDGVQQTIKTLSDKREALHEQLDADPKEIARLTSLIRELSAAVDELIPKYTAQAQKLDYDGDQIEIHAAKTSEARKDIKKHFDQFHVSDPTKDPTTAQAFRTKFLADAVQTPTGDYLLAESVKAFEKKFSGKGIDFLRTPFLTKEFEHLSGEQALSVLAGNKSLGSPLKILEDAVKSKIPSGTKSEEIISHLSTVPVSEDVSAYSKNLMIALRDSFGDFSNVIERGVKGRLYEERMGDAVEAQLYKIHTGSETEAIYRLHRMAEMNIGFGKGQIGLGGYKTSPYFEGRYPKGLKSMGGSPEEEFHGMINEVLRFGIQKGMDVKHAGAKPVAGEMSEFLARGPKGAEELYRRIMEDDSYKELKEFSDTNKEVIDRRLGALSTDELRDEAYNILGARGEDTSIAIGADRSKLKDIITKAVGFEGFLKELSLVVKQEAIEGLVAQASGWSEKTKNKPPKQYGKTPVTGDIRKWATGVVEKQMAEDGISVRDFAMKGQQPLYSFRTFGATPKAEFDKYFQREGDMSVEGELHGMDPSKRDDEYVKKFKRAKAVAENLQYEAKKFSHTGQGGAYSEMVKSSIELLHDQNKYILEIASNIAKSGYDHGEAKKMDYYDRLVKSPSTGLLPYVADVLLQKPEERHKNIEMLSGIAGVPTISDAEEFDVLQRYGKPIKESKLRALRQHGYNEEEAEEKANIYTGNMIDMIKSLKQLDRIVDVVGARRYEGELLSSFIPSVKHKEHISTEISQDQIDAIKAERIYRKSTDPFAREAVHTMTSSGESDGAQSPGSGAGKPPGSGFGMMPTSGDVVPVFIVGANPGVLVGVGEMQGNFAAAYPENQLLSQFESDIGRLKTLIEKSSSKADTIESFKDFISPSRLAGGGFTYDRRGKGLPAGYSEENRRKEQIEKLMETMQGAETTGGPKKESTLDVGTALHVKLAAAAKKDPNLKDLIDTERYKEEEYSGIGKVGGTADLVKYTDTTKKDVEKIVDFKTVSEEEFKKIGELIDTARSSDIKDIIKTADDHIKRKLEDYFSQINAYLDIFDSEKGELWFYSREGKGDEPSSRQTITINRDNERFQEDLAAVFDARKNIIAGAGKFASIERKPIPGQDLGDKEIDEMIDLAYSIFNRQRSYKKPIDVARQMTSQGSKEKRAQQDVPFRHFDDSEMKNLKNVFTPDELNRFLIPPEITTGSDTEAVHKNLKVLHDQSILYQKSKGLSRDYMGNMNTEVQKLIQEARESGPDYEKFIAVTEKLRDMDAHDFKGADFNKAWKMYRMSVGDFFLKRADEAIEMYEAARESGDYEGQHQAYGKFQESVVRMQEFIRRNIGKRTDIYTEDKHFVYPGAAKGAGVYMSPKQIIDKVGEPLGDDEKLQEVFKSIVSGFAGVDMESPSESARKAFRELSDMRTDFVSILSDDDKFGRLNKSNIDDLLADGEKLKNLGPRIVEAWDFDKLASRATRLRAAFADILKTSGELNEEQKRNIGNIIKHLKKVESFYSSIGSKDDMGWGQMGVVPVPKFETPDVQKALHRRNIQAVRDYFSRSEESGGPAVGEKFAYTEKITGDSGEVVKNVKHHFDKYGEAVESSGRKVGLFNEESQDMVRGATTLGSTFRNAAKRVVMWGSAAKLIYGGVSYLKDSVKEIADIEVAMARLKMVMNEMDTDFEKMSKSAVSMGKQYGVPVTDVLASMRVFAQQGLKQNEVIDRTRTATLASNVTTLNAKDATEALTSAMQIFHEEGNQSMRFLDSWSEVESKHAITADDMANAIKRSAAAAKTAGVTFDELNGIVASIGAVTRQTGSEVGTSLRFIFRRLFAEKGPQALAKFNIPVVTDTGDLRSGTEVLGDLAEKWKDLSSAQKMDIAQSIGGTRQFNSLIVLMEQWDEAVRGMNNSLNSKGSAERRNMEIMKTYEKQLQQTRVAASELKMEFGKIVLPAFKAGLTSIKLFTEGITSIPNSIKLAAASGLMMFGALSKGVPIIDNIVETMSKGSSLFGGIGQDFAKQMKIAKYEITGKGKGEDLFGLKTLTQKDGLPMGKGIDDFHSSLGKLLYIIKEVGLAYNEMVGKAVVGTGAAASAIGEKTRSIGSFFSLSAGSIFKEEEGVGLGKAVGLLRGAAKSKGLGPEEVLKTIKTGGLKGGLKVASKALGFTTELAGLGTAFVGEMIDSVGEHLGESGHKMLKSFASEETGLVKAIAPLALTTAALIPTFKALYGEYSKMSSTAQDYEKSVDGSRKHVETELSGVRGLTQSYDTLENKLEDIKKAQAPDVKQRRVELGTYEAPLVGMQKIQKEAIDLSNALAETNLNLVVGYDRLGNAVLKTADDYRTYTKQLENLKITQGVDVEVDILDKYIHSLTETGGSEKFKAAFKELAESFPVIGELVSKNINIGPAKAIEMAVEDINKRLNLKQKFPLSNAMDEEIKNMQASLSSARGVFQETYSDFERVYAGVVSPSNLKGLTELQIKKVLTSDTMKKAYELKIAVDPKFELVKGITPEDIMGKEVLTALNPNLAGLLDVSSEFTKANLESAGMLKRTEGKAYSGDVITLFKDFAEKNSVAGKQAILKMKEDVDGELSWVVQYFNSRTLKVEERPLSEVEKFVESVFPFKQIQEDLSYRLDSLNTFISGASAGLIGISDKDFKKDFNIGERFFSEIPTTLLLQSDKGFMPGKGYTEIPGMKDFRSDIEKYYFKPQEELRLKIEQFDKLNLEGLEGPDLTISKDMYEEINTLLDVLKNNQAVLQFKAVFVDLMKEFSEGSRVLQQSLAATKQRFEFDRETAGLMKGVSVGLDNINTGVHRRSDLSTKQMLLLQDKDYREQAKEMVQLTKILDDGKSKMDSAAKALVNLEDIRAVAKGFGATIDESNLSKFVKEVTKQSDESGPFVELLNIDKGIEQNTADTVGRLDKLIENQSDFEAVERIIQRANSPFSVHGAAESMEKLARIRERAEKAGDTEAVVNANRALDIMTKRMVSEHGLRKGSKAIEDHFTFSKKRFTPEEFQQRAFAGVDTDVFLQKMGEYGEGYNKFSFRTMDYTKKAPEFSDSEELKKIRELSEDYRDSQWISSRRLAQIQAGIAAASYIEKRGNSKVVSRLDDQIAVLDSQIFDATEKKDTTKVRDLVKKRQSIAEERDEVQKNVDFYGMVTSLSAAGTAATELAMAFGLPESTVKKLDVATIGLLAAVQLSAKLLGEEVPDSAKKFSEKLVELGKNAALTGEPPSKLELFEASRAGKAFAKDVKDQTKKVFGKDAESIEKEAARLAQQELSSEKDPDKIKAHLEKAIHDGYFEKIGDLSNIQKETDEYRAKGKEYASYDDLFKKHKKERGELISAGNHYDSIEFADFMKKVERERFEWGKDISVAKQKEIISTHPVEKRKLLGGSAGASDLSDAGLIARRGAEVDEMPSRAMQALAVYAASSLADYAAKKSEDKVVLATFEKRMEEQQKYFSKAIEKYPDAAQKVIDDMYKEMGDTSKSGDLETVTESLVQNTDEEYKKVVDLVKDYNSKIRQEYEQHMERLADIQAKALDKEIRMRDKQTLETSLMSYHEGLRKRKLDADYSVNRGLSGFMGDVPLPFTDKGQMSTQQRFYKDADPKMKNIFNAMAENTHLMEAQKGYIGELQRRAMEDTIFVNTTDDDRLKKDAENRLKDYEEKIQKSTSNLDRLTESIRGLSETASHMFRFEEAVNKLTDSLKNVGIQDSIDSLLSGFVEARDKLLGGAHPKAAISITPEQEYMASRVGVRLDDMRSNKFDLRRAELKLRAQTESGEPLSKTMRELHHFEEEQRREELAYKQRQENSKLLRSLSPYEDMISESARMKTIPGLDKNVYKKLDSYQVQMAAMMERAFGETTPEEMLDELEANKRKLSKEEYMSEKDRYTKLKDDKDVVSIFRGLPLWEMKDPQGMISEVSDIYKKTLIDTGDKDVLKMQAAFDDPAKMITSKIEETNRILTAIAEKGYGLDVRKSDTFGKGTGDTLGLGQSFIGRLFSDIFGFASGGHISGPGGPTSDSIPAYLSAGEYVIRASSVNKLGVGTLDYMNSKGMVPKFNQGGLADKEKIHYYTSYGDNIIRHDDMGSFKKASDYIQKREFESYMDISNYGKSKPVKVDLYGSEKLIDSGKKEVVEKHKEIIAEPVKAVISGKTGKDYSKGKTEDTEYLKSVSKESYNVITDYPIEDKKSLGSFNKASDVIDYADKFMTDDFVKDITSSKQKSDFIRGLTLSKEQIDAGQFETFHEKIGESARALESIGKFPLDVYTDPKEALWDRPQMSRHLDIMKKHWVDIPKEYWSKSIPSDIDLIRSNFFDFGVMKKHWVDIPKEYWGSELDLLGSSLVGKFFETVGRLPFDSMQFVYDAVTNPKKTLYDIPLDFYNIRQEVEGTGKLAMRGIDAIERFLQASVDPETYRQIYSDRIKDPLHNEWLLKKESASEKWAGTKNKFEYTKKYLESAYKGEEPPDINTFGMHTGKKYGAKPTDEYWIRYLKQGYRTVTSLEGAMGTSEALVEFLTSGLSTVAAGYTGIGSVVNTAITGGDYNDVLENMGYAFDKLSYAPKSEVGKESSYLIHRPFELYSSFGENLGNIVMDETGAATAGAFTASFIQSLPILRGPVLSAPKSMLLAPERLLDRKLFGYDFHLMADKAKARMRTEGYSKKAEKKYRSDLRKIENKENAILHNPEVFSNKDALTLRLKLAKDKLKLAEDYTKSNAKRARMRSNVDMGLTMGEASRQGFKLNLDEKKADGFSVGGAVYGPGGPTSDSIPAYLSAGEYVIRASSVDKLGVDTLDHMNQFGQLPKFAQGGQVRKKIDPETGEAVDIGKFESISNNISDLKKQIKSSRLESVNKDGLKGFAKQGSHAAAELVLASASAISDLFNLSERSAAYLADNDLNKIKEDASALYNGIGVLLKDIYENQPEYAKKITGAFKDELSSGGIGLTSAAIGSFRVGNLSSVLSKTKHLTSNIPDVGNKVMLKAAGYEKGKKMMEDASSIYRRDAGGKIIDQLGPGSHTAMSLMYSPGAENLFKYLPDNAKYLASGAEAVVFDTGKGAVARFGPYSEIPNVEGVLQPVRRFKHGDLSVDYFPKVDTNIPSDMSLKVINSLEKKLAGSGYEFFDRHIGNVGIYKGKSVVIDPGAISKATQKKRPQQKLPKVADDFDAGAAGKKLEELLSMEGMFSGGSVFASGGSTSASIPAWLSNGEYVLRSDAVDRIGLSTLNYINQRGEIPGFSKGGSVEEDIIKGNEGYKKAALEILRRTRGDGEVSIDKLPENLREFVAPEYIGIKAQYDTPQYREMLEYKKYTQDKLDRNNLFKSEIVRSLLANPSEYSVKGASIGDKWRNESTHGLLAGTASEEDKLPSQILGLTKRLDTINQVSKAISGGEELPKWMKQEQVDIMNSAYQLGSQMMTEFNSEGDSLAASIFKYIGGKGNYRDALNSGDANALLAQKDAMRGYKDRMVHSPLYQAQLDRVERDYKLTAEGFEYGQAQKEFAGQMEKYVGSHYMMSFFQDPELFITTRNAIDSGVAPKTLKENIRKLRDTGKNVDKKDIENKKDSPSKDDFDKMRQRPEEKDKSIMGRIKEFFRSTKQDDTESKRDELEKRIGSSLTVFSKAFGGLINGSAPVYHNGGVVAQTGKIFAERGEVIFPKGFFKGGLATGGPSEKALFGSLDTTNIVQKLSNIKLSVDAPDKIKVDAPVLKVDLSRKIEVEKPNWEVEVEKPGWKIDVDDKKLEVSVIKPDWGIDVNMPKEPISVKVDIPKDVALKVDVSDAAVRLSSAISDALNKPVKVEYTGGNGDRSVGSDKLDNVSKALENVNNRVFKIQSEIDDMKMVDLNVDPDEIGRMVKPAVTSVIDDVKAEIYNVCEQLDQKIKDVQVSVESRIRSSSIQSDGVLDVERRILPIVNNAISQMKAEVNEVKSALSNVRSETRLRKFEIDSKLTDIIRRISETSSILGSQFS